MLLGRDGQGDRARAIELLSDALRTCDQLGMSALRVKVAEALTRAGDATSAAHPQPSAGHRIQPRDTSVPASVSDGTFLLEGEYWTVGYEGRVVRLRDSKGMRVLARLLANPGRPHASLDLERLNAPGDEATARAVASGDAGEVLDAEALRAYRARLLELREAVDDEEARGNADQAGAMREEIDFIAHELSRALGLGGRSRRTGSIAERARLNVTRAARSAIRRIAAADAGLAAHLETTVHTGMVCVYSPDPRSPVGWRVSLGDVHQH